MQIGLSLSAHGRELLWRPVEIGVLRLGSNPECELCVPDAAVAGVHALLRREGNTLTLVNRAGAAIEVGGERVTDELRLGDGDSFVLGPMTVHVRFRPDVETAAVPSGTRTLAPRARGAGELALVVPELHPGRRWPVDKRGLAIGSDPTNDLVLTDPYVSTFHARFTNEDGRLIVRDLGSRNGVFVNEQLVREGEVAPGATVRIGETSLQVVKLDADAPAAAGRASPTWRLIGRSAAMERVRTLVRRVAAHDAPVLITGETGTGKEVVARSLALQSPRADEPFVALNCGALSRTLIESELFGHEKGAFTGAQQRKAGAFEAADGGTLFLDEIGELPLELQPQLLRVLETGEVRRVGGNDTLTVNVRLVAATHRKLEIEVAHGRFREDLFHRLHVLTVGLPPLRERREDIEELALHFARTFSPPGERVELDKGAMALLLGYAWPGNVRELRNVVQRAVLMRAGDRVEAGDVTFVSTSLPAKVEAVAAVSPGKTLAELERAAICAELVRHRGNKKETALALGVSRSTIHRKLDEYAIDVPALVGHPVSDE